MLSLFKMFLLCSSWVLCMHSEFLKTLHSEASLVVQWIRIRQPMQGAQVRSLVREDSTCCETVGPYTMATKSALWSPHLHQSSALAASTSPPRGGEDYREGAKTSASASARRSSQLHLSLPFGWVI